MLGRELRDGCGRSPDTDWSLRSTLSHATVPGAVVTLVFPLVTFTTLGPGDVTPSHEWRIPGAFEVASGVRYPKSFR